MITQVVLTTALACTLAKPGGIVAPGFVAHHGLGPIAPVAAPWAARLAAPIAAPLAAHIAAPLAAPIAAPLAAPLLAAPAPIAHSKYHVQNEIGQASYGHAEAFQTHNAIQDAAGNKIGSFSHVSPEGLVFKTDYVADALGYRVASNALPVGPTLPAADTPEVAAAKAAHFAAYNAVLHRQRRSIVAPVAHALAAPLAIGHTPAATAPLGASLAAPIAAPLAAPIARVAAPIAAPLTIGHTPAATAPLGAPLAAPIARVAAPIASVAAPLAIGHTPAATAPLATGWAAPWAARALW